MLDVFRIRNFMAIYDINFKLLPLTAFCGNDSKENDSFFEALRIMTNFSKAKYSVEDFFYKDPATNKHTSSETNINFSLKTGLDFNINAQLGLTLGQNYNLYVLSSFLEREINEKEFLFVKYYARAKFECLIPGKTLYRNRIDPNHGFSLTQLNDQYLLDPYSAYRIGEKHYPKEDYKKTSFTFPYVEAKEFLPESLVYPDIESKYSYYLKNEICDRFYKLIRDVPSDPLKTEAEIENYTYKKLIKHNIDKKTADFLLDLLLTPHEDFYPNCLSYIFKMDNYFENFKCRENPDSLYLIRITDWYKTLSNIDSQEKEIIIEKLQNDLDSIGSNIEQCMLKYKHNFIIKEAQRFKLPYHLKEAKDYVRRFFNANANSAYPCIKYIRRQPKNIKDDKYIEKIREICLRTKPFSTIVITEPEERLTQNKFKAELTDFIMAVIQNEKQVILKTNCDFIIRKIKEKKKDFIKIY